MENSILNLITKIIKEAGPYKNIKIFHSNIKIDILSGIMVSIIVLPLALAFGEISQLGPKAGILGAVIGGIVGGLFGGCVVGVSGPTAPMASQIALFMSAFVIGTTNKPDLTAAFSIIFLSGLILILISFLKISKFINYIPYPVIAGFMCGIGIIVTLSQINPFFGIEIEKNIYNVFRDFRYTIQNINYQTLYVSIPCLLILFLWEFIVIKFKSVKNIPSSLIILIIGTGIAYSMNLEIPYIGDKMNIENNSSIFQFYLPDFSRFVEFLLPASLLAGLAIIDSLLTCKIADNITGLRHNSDREAFSQGVTNMTSGIFGGISTATATTQTVGNIKFGAKTSLSSIVNGIILLGILLGLSNFLSLIPNVCLAIILFKLGFDILDYRILPVLKKIPAYDLFIFIVVLFITVYKNLMFGVGIGILLSIIKSSPEIIAVLKKNSKHKIYNIKNLNVDLSEADKNKLIEFSPVVLNLEGPLFFGTTERVIKIYNNSQKHKILIVDMKKVTKVDLSGLYCLDDLVQRAIESKIKVYISNAKSSTVDLINEVNILKDCSFNKSNKEIFTSIINSRN